MANTSIIPKCLENYIGIKAECNPIAPTSGLYIDDLEGINMNVISKIQSGTTAIKFLRDKINRGIALTLDDFRTYANPYYNIKSVMHFTIPGAFNTTYLPFDANERGLVINNNTYQSCNSCWTWNYQGNRNMQRIFIGRVRILSNTTISGKTLIIRDGIYTTTYTVDLVAGIETIVNVDYLAQTNQIYIVMDDSDVEMNQGNLENCFIPCNSCHGALRNHKYLNIQGWDGFTTTSYLYGILPEIKITCNEELLYCALADRMKWLFLYRSGIEIAKAWRVSDRTNEMTLINEEKAKIIMGIWVNEYESRYKAFQFSIRDMLRTFDGNCIECRGLTLQYST